MESENSRATSTESTKKILHFSDGVLEISDEEEVDHPTSTPVDTKQLDWGPWAAHMTLQAGSKTLQVCDYLGESLASFFGITTPKYQFEIDEYHRMKKAEEEAAKEKDLEIGTWANKETPTVLSPPITTVESSPPMKY